MSSFKVSVIISTFSIERSWLVQRCIDSLLNQLYPPHEILLVLEQDEELRKHYERLMLSGIEVITSRGRGLSEARNTGAMRSSGEIVAFIDDDAIADKNWLKNLVKNFEDPRVIGVGGAVKPLWIGGRPKWFPEELDWIVGCTYRGLPEHKAYARNPIGSNMAFRKEVFERVSFRKDLGRIGGRLVGSEETEFSLRVLREFPNSKIIYDPSAMVYHIITGDKVNLKYFTKRAFYEGLSKGLLRKIHKEDMLSVEKRYLLYLLRVSIPLKARHLYRPESLAQLVTITSAIILVTLGFFIASYTVLSTQLNI